MIEVNPYQWFGKRRIDHIPKHFVTAKTKLTEESLLWVIRTLVGRYSVTMGDDFFMLNPTQIGDISFEDPSECVAFELRWA